MGEEIPKDWVRIVMKALAYLGLIIMAIALVFYVRYQNGALNFIRTKAVITELRTDPADTSRQIVTIVWNIGNTSYKETESEQLFKQLHHQQGDTIEIMVNPDDFNEMILMEAEPFLTDSAWNLGKVGITFFMISIGIWAMRKFKN